VDGLDTLYVSRWWANLYVRGSQPRQGRPVEQIRKNPIKLGTHEGRHVEGLSILVKSGLKSVSLLLKGISAVAAAEEMTQCIGHNELVGPEVLPLDYMNQFVEVQRLDALVVIAHEIGGEVGDT